MLAAWQGVNSNFRRQAVRCRRSVLVLTDTDMPKPCKLGLWHKNVKQKRAVAQKVAFVRTVRTPLATGLGLCQLWGRVDCDHVRWPKDNEQGIMRHLRKSKMRTSAKVGCNMRMEKMRKFHWCESQWSFGRITGTSGHADDWPTRGLRHATARDRFHLATSSVTVIHRWTISQQLVWGQGSRNHSL